MRGDSPGSSGLVFEPGLIRAGSYRFDIGTAGSAVLVAQTVIPVLLRAGGPSEVEIFGGTHVHYAPTYEFLRDVYLPRLRAMGAEVSVGIGGFGFYPAGGGSIKVAVAPFAASGDPRGNSIVEAGAYCGGRVVGVCAGLPRGIAVDEVEIVAGKLPELTLEKEVVEVESRGCGNVVQVELRFERITEVFSSIGKTGVSRKEVANRLVGEVRSYLEAGAPVGCYLADQLQVPLVALCGGGKYVTGRPSSHHWTNWSVMGKFLVDSAMTQVPVGGAGAVEHVAAEPLFRIGPRAALVLRPGRLAGANLGQELVAGAGGKAVEVGLHTRLPLLLLAGARGVGVEHAGIFDENGAGQLGIARRQRQGGGAAHRMAQHRRPVEAQRANGAGQVVGHGEGVIAVGGRIRAAVAAGVDHNDVIVGFEGAGDGRPAGAVVGIAVGQHQWGPVAARAGIVQAQAVGQHIAR